MDLYYIMYPAPADEAFPRTERSEKEEEMTKKGRGNAVIVAAVEIEIVARSMSHLKRIT
jgi:hypothetical protein